MDKVLDIIKLIRPKFYNGLTWTMVLAGIGMMSNSLWVGIANGITEKFYDFSILDKFSPIYGLVLIVFALIFNTINLFLDKQEQPKIDTENRGDAGQKEREQKEYEHDMEIYTRESAILGQKEVDYFCDFVGANHSYMNEDINCLWNFYKHEQLSENRYFNDVVLSSRREFAQACRKLSGFISKHFFVFPNFKIQGQLQHALYPDLNVDRGGSGKPDDMALYDKYADQLQDLLEEFQSEFESYRLSVKKEFMI